MSIKKKIVFFCMILLLQKVYSQNGYRLEFEDVITLSVDSVWVPLTAPTTRVKSYTVPLGTVLKITGGHISMIGGGAGITRMMTGYLQIDNQQILGADTNVVTFVSPFKTAIIIKPDNPIWVPGGSTVSIVAILHATPTGSGTLTMFCSNWITGVVYRKVPN